MTLDADGRVRALDEAAVALLGPRAEVVGRRLVVGDPLEDEQRAERQRADERALAALNAVAREQATRGEDADVDAALARAACVVTGATGAAVFAEHEEGGLVVTHAAGWNRKGARVLPGAHSGAALVFATGEQLFAPDAQHDGRLSSANLRQSRAASVAIWPVWTDGRTVGAVLVWWASPVQALSERVRHLLAMVADAAAVAIERRAAVGELEALTRTDPLTGVRNRRALDETLARRLAATTDEPVSLVLLDLDHFKRYNDRHGHPAGDRQLRACATAWAAGLRKQDLLARFGGEEFAVVLEDTSQDEALVRADALRDLVAGGETCSAGVATWDGAESPGELIARADAALYSAKAAGRNLSCGAVAGRVVRRPGPSRGPGPVAAPELASGGALRRALAGGRFELHYQPIVAAGGGELAGLEALLRCRSTSGRLVGPEAFISLAERTGAISGLGGWVVQAACAQVAQWRRAGFVVPVTAVNISPRQLDGPDVGALITRTLDHYDLPPSALCVEVTESALISGPERLVRLLADLRVEGVRTALDDFGKGHSSLARLGALPVDTVKVDRTLIADAATSPRAAQLLRGVVSLVTSVGHDVVLEGIETVEQRRAGEQTGARWLQGFLFARPAPAREVEALLAAPAAPWATPT